MKKKIAHSALHEKEGIPPPEIFSTTSIEKITHFRKLQPTASELIAGILKSDKVALSRGITLIESTNADHSSKANDVISGCLPHANQSVRIGITGVPGVGKSTFIESFGTYLTTLGKQVAVLAVDPSSSLSHGSILGDKTRMEELVKNEKAFIRPSASGDTLGGVARKTREAIILCEAAGYDVILIETVGVGQSETAVHGMVDFFLLLKISGAGDELQGIKRGIMEMADAIVINKADGDNINKAKLAKTEFSRALHLFPLKKSGWQPQVLTCSATENTGIETIWQTMEDYFSLVQKNQFFDANRQQQSQYWMMETINDQLKGNFYSDPKVTASLEHLKKLVVDHKVSPFTAASELLEMYFKK